VNLASTIVTLSLAVLVGIDLPSRPVRASPAAEPVPPSVCHWIGTVSKPAERLDASQYLVTLDVGRDLGTTGVAGEQTLVLNSTYGASYYRGIDLRPGQALEARGYLRQGAQCVVDSLNVGTLEPGFEGFLRPANVCPTAGEATIALSVRASLPLGCAASPVVSASTALQRFEGGLMLHLNGIYVLGYGPEALGQARRGGGSWTGVRDTYREPEPARIGLTPPSGELREPLLGFGKAWREQYGGPDGPLGWAVDEEHSETADWQQFDHGIVVVSRSGDGFMLYYHEGRVWEQKRR
jgi:hypothetical protein